MIGLLQHASCKLMVAWLCYMTYRYNSSLDPLQARSGIRPLSEPMLIFVKSKRMYNLEQMILFIQDNAFENIRCKMAHILFRPQNISHNAHWWSLYSHLLILICCVYVTFLQLIRSWLEFTQLPVYGDMVSCLLHTKVIYSHASARCTRPVVNLSCPESVRYKAGRVDDIRLVLIYFTRMSSNGNIFRVIGPL